MQQFKSNQQKEKVYTSLVIVGVISSIMLFAGLSSAVLVRKMDKFWVNIHLPNAFMVSTIIILISSLLMYLALKNARLSNKKKTVNYLIGSFILCLFFTFFQFQGWKKYYQQGNAVKSFITFVYGQYGQSYLIYDSGIPIEYNGEDYMKDGKKLR